MHLNKAETFWNNILWTDETKVEMFGHYALCHIWQKPNIALHHKHLMAIVKQGGGGVMTWAWQNL